MKSTFEGYGEHWWRCCERAGFKSCLGTNVLVDVGQNTSPSFNLFIHKMRIIIVYLPHRVAIRITLV